jgi:hypothetical protein
MKTDENKMISLYKRLLDITEKEQNEITDCNIDKMEYYWSLKEDIIGELEKMNNGEPWISSRKQSGEIESLIKRIISANKTNAAAVSEMKKSLLKDISSIHNNKKAVSAYQSS